MSRYSLVIVAHFFPLELKIYKLALHVSECLIKSFPFITWLVSGTMLSAEYVGTLLNDDNSDPVLIGISSSGHEIIALAWDLDRWVCSVFGMVSLVWLNLFLGKFVVSENGLCLLVCSLI